MGKFSENIKELRTNTGLNQTVVANSLGLQYFTLGKWEQGRAEPSIEDLTKLADFFNVSIDYLVGREDDFGNITVSGQSTDQLTKDERELLSCFNELGPFERDAILIQIKALSGHKNKTKEEV